MDSVFDPALDSRDRNSGAYRDRNVRILTDAKVEAIEPDGIVYEQLGEKKKEPFDTVIVAVGSKPVRKLTEALIAAGMHPKTVGDCNAPQWQPRFRSRLR